jgi:DNA adenine methylase
MGHYDGYSLQDYTDLLEALSQMKGKFLLSSYPSDVLKDYVKRLGWWQKTFDMRKVSVNLLAAKNTGTKKRKMEVLTANYEI